MTATAVSLFEVFNPLGLINTVLPGNVIVFALFWASFVVDALLGGELFS
jgi:ABC-type spermidine/putrescine transport system permease subunit I